MYESQFGLSGPPFQLNPDPEFYFDSRGHSHALSYLKYGVYQGEGFIVVTGEIGAGKTTLVRTLLSGLDPAKVVAAQVVSTQLESSDLLHAIIAAFGIKPLGGSKAQALATLEAFLTLLASQQRRALLVVDEAQNLNREAIEELRMLSNFQIGNHALLQSFLIGQPELRRILESPSMEQLRQRVIASCHLGPLDAGETRAYIEHRLRRVGWESTPSFTRESFDAIHKATGGIPRRINMLCNRLFLGAFLSGDHALTPDTVDSTSRELRGEVGEVGGPTHKLVPGSRAPAPPATGPGQPATADAAGAEGGATLQAVPAGIERHRSALDACIVALVDSPADYLKACVLQSEVTRLNIASGLALLNPHQESEVVPSLEVAACMALPAQEFHLGARRGPFAGSLLDSLAGMSQVFDRLRPSAVCVFGASDAVLAGALMARKLGIPVVRFDAGRRAAPNGEDAMINEMLLDRVADSLFTTALTAHYTLYREGIASSHVVCGGSLATDVIQRLMPVVPAPAGVLERALGPSAAAAGSGPWVLVNPVPQRVAQDVDEFREVVGLLAAVAPEVSTLWVADEHTAQAIERYRMRTFLEQSSIHVVPAHDPLDRLSLLLNAHCLVSAGSVVMMEEATSLGVARVAIGRGAAGGDQWGSVSAGCNAKRLQGLVADAMRARQHQADPAATLELAAAAAGTHLKSVVRRTNVERRSGARPGLGA